MMADVIGTSILTFDLVAKQLGWIFLFFSLAFYGAISYYTALLMMETFRIIKNKTGRTIESMGKAAYYSLGDRPGSIISKLSYGITTLIVYGYAFMGNATYLLVIIFTNINQY